MIAANMPDPTADGVGMGASLARTARPSGPPVEDGDHGEARPPRSSRALRVVTPSTSSAKELTPDEWRRLFARPFVPEDWVTT